MQQPSSLGAEKDVAGLACQGWIRASELAVPGPGPDSQKLKSRPRPPSGVGLTTEARPKADEWRVPILISIQKILYFTPGQSDTRRGVIYQFRQKSPRFSPKSGPSLKRKGNRSPAACPSPSLCCFGTIRTPGLSLGATIRPQRTNASPVFCVCTLGLRWGETAA
ncbi:hypothetical protein BDW60DRAFT_137735 [Aspergillus nidulans var. acristatus]